MHSALETQFVDHSEVHVMFYRQFQCAVMAFPLMLYIYGQWVLVKYYVTVAGMYLNSEKTVCF